LLLPHGLAALTHKMGFGMADPAAVKAYHRRKNVVRLVGIVFGLIYTVVWCWIAPAWVDRLTDVIDYRWLVLLGVAGGMFLLQEFLMLPMSYYSAYVLEHRYDLSNENVRGWLIREAKELAVGAVFGAVLLAGLYGLLWYSGRLWWVFLWLGWIFLAVVLTQLFPVLILPIFYKTTPIEDASLVERLRGLAEGTGITLSGVYRLGLSEETKKPNAMLTGLGSTRRVLLSDTLLDAFYRAKSKRFSCTSWAITPGATSTRASQCRRRWPHWSWGESSGDWVLMRAAIQRPGQAR